LSGSNGIPVDVFEEFVSFHLFSVISGSKTFLRISVEEQENDLASIVRHCMRNLQWALLNVLKKLGLACVEVGRNSDKHLVDKNT